MTTTPEPRELAAQILSRITAEPESLDMNSWMDGCTVLYAKDPVDCGTTLCVAGWAVHLAGWSLHTTGPHPDDPDGDEADVMATKDGGPAQFVPEVAAELLGLNKGESTELFFETDPLVATEMVRQLANGDQLDYPAAYAAAYTRPRPA